MKPASHGWFHLSLQTYSLRVS